MDPILNNVQYFSIYPLYTSTSFQINEMPISIHGKNALKPLLSLKHIIHI